MKKENFSISEYIEIKDDQLNEIDNFVNDTINDNGLKSFQIEIKKSFFDGMIVVLVKSEQNKLLLESKVFEVSRDLYSEIEDFLDNSWDRKLEMRNF